MNVSNILIMKKDFFKYTLLALMAVGMLSIMSWKEEEEREPSTTKGAICETIEEIPIEDEELTTNFIRVYMGSNDYIKVNSQAEYDSLFPDCTLPKKVDFESKTLYVVKRTLIHPFISEKTSCYYSFGGNYVNIYIDVETDREAEQIYSNYLKVFTANKPKENQKVFLCLNIDYEQPWF
jgi:hypothetical protein